LRDLAVARRDAPDVDRFAVQTDDVLVRAGGLKRVVAACEEHLAKGPEDWHAYAQPHLWEQRHWLYRLVDALPLAAGPDAAGILDAMGHLQCTRERPPDLVEATFEDQFLDPEWRAGVIVPEEPGVYRFRPLETATFFELVDALKGGDIYEEGAANYGAFTEDIFPIESQPEAVAQFLKDRGFPDSAQEYVRDLRERLHRDVLSMEHAVGTDQTVLLRPDGQPITPRPRGIKPPLSAQQLAEVIQERMPPRSVLEALYNTDRWSGWTRHFGPPGRLSSQIEDRQRRCVLTTFAVGSGLGAAQAARHFDEPISPHLLSFVHRRHMGSASLRAACADVLNQYAKFELPIHWGPSDKVAADGSLLTTYEDNIQASYHVRYRRTGAVAYRHVGTNYIAYFTNFLVAGAYEGAYLFDALQKNESVLKATGIYSDTHGQSAVLFAVAELFNVELLPRIRHWRSLTLYRPDLKMNLSHTGHLYGGTIDWVLIESHWKEFLRVAVAIQSGRVTPSWVLTRLNSYSRRNKLYRAFRELGRVFRTLYLLRWIDDDDLRRTVTHEANKVEHYHDFASHLNFGSHGVLRTNSRVDQEKAMIANQLVANAVISQTVADQTRVIQQLKSEGYPFKLSDVKHLSPYLTRHLLRFGKFPVRCKTEPLPDNLGLNP
jgi:TnpA family transposase